MTLPHLACPSSTLAACSLSPYLSPSRQHALGVAGGARVAEVTSDRAFITSVWQYGHGRRVGGNGHEQELEMSQEGGRFILKKVLCS